VTAEAGFTYRLIYADDSEPVIDQLRRFPVLERSRGEVRERWVNAQWVPFTQKGGTV
jgi:hypothetical protein